MIEVYITYNEKSFNQRIVIKVPGSTETTVDDSNRSFLSEDECQNEVFSVVEKFASLGPLVGISLVGMPIFYNNSNSLVGVGTYLSPRIENNTTCIPTMCANGPIHSNYAAVANNIMSSTTGVFSPIAVSNNLKTQCFGISQGKDCLQVGEGDPLLSYIAENYGYFPQSRVISVMPSSSPTIDASFGESFIFSALSNSTILTDHDAHIYGIFMVGTSIVVPSTTAKGFNVYKAGEDFRSNEYIEISFRGGEEQIKNWEPTPHQISTLKNKRRFLQEADQKWLDSLKS